MIYITQGARQHLSKRQWDPYDVERASLHPNCNPLTIDRVRGVAHEYDEHAKHMLHAQRHFEQQ